ncbi:MAG: hypothetical protein WC558_05105 [Patulibacter sp.]
MRNVAIVLGVVIGLGWIAVGAAGGGTGAIVVGVALLGLSASVITISRLARRSGLSLTPAKVPYELRHVFGGEAEEYRRVVADPRRFEGTVVALENDGSELGVGRFGTRIVIDLDDDPRGGPDAGRRVTIREFLGPAETLELAPGTTVSLLRSDAHGRYLLATHAQAASAE